LDTLGIQADLRVYKGER